MNKERILKEAQKIATKFSFWMVSGEISHLYGNVYETADKKYDMEIKFDENFPNSPPQFIYRDTIKNLLGDIQLEGLKFWSSEFSVVKLIEELKTKILNSLNKKKESDDLKIEAITSQMEEKLQKETTFDQKSQKKIVSSESEEYITPDLDAYPPDLDFEQIEHQTTPEEEFFYANDQLSAAEDSSETNNSYMPVDDIEEKTESLELSSQVSLEINTELGLIQQYFAYDQQGSNPADIKVYMTITIAKTFIIGINFSDYPKYPIIALPKQLKNILGDPYESLSTLKKWNVKKPPHIIDVLHETENKLLFITDIENEAKKILSEYKCNEAEGIFSKFKVHLVTYGFKEYLLELDLMPYPKPPEVILSSELQNIIQTPITSLTSYKNWKENESEPVEIIREIAWLVDKNSRINFEIELLKEHYKDLNYESTTQTLDINMKGKMKTQDITFEFQINLPEDYPMKMPDIKVLNEFELETHEKIKSDLQTSFKDFFDEWSPYSYLVDLFNLISEKIFEVSVVACVICHKIECPTCSVRIAGPGESCHVFCIYCDRAYHKHCWDQTIKSFGKCGFCLKVPPPDMMP